MTDVLNVLKTAKDCIIEVSKQLDALENIKELGIKKLPLYIETINALSSSIDNLTLIFNKDIPIQHKLKRLVILSLKIDLDDFADNLKGCKDYYDFIIERKKKKCTIGFKTLIGCKKKALSYLPVEMLAKLESTFEVINEKIQDVIELEKTIFGSAIAIKHPVLQKAWMKCGLNQLNDSELPENMIIQSLFLMFQEEENGKLKNNKKCLELITNFVNDLDKNCIAEPDGRISIHELNKIEFKKCDAYDQYTVKKLLHLKEQPDFDESERCDDCSLNAKESDDSLSYNNIDSNSDSSNDDEVQLSNIDIVVSRSKKSSYIMPNVAVIFDEPVHVPFNNAVEIPPCEGYGSNGPSKLGCEIIIPDFNLINKVFCGVEINCNAGDQGWGGTGHSSVRYQVNDNMPVVAFFIDRNKFSDGNYKFVIPPNQVTANSKIKLWVCSAPWSGWSAVLKSVDANLIYG
jgi:hypothetical protein